MGGFQIVLLCGLLLVLVSGCSGEQAGDGQLHVHLADLLTKLTHLLDDREQRAVQMDRLELLVRCKPPAQLDHGSVKESVVGGQLVLRFSCDKRYKLEGETALSCHGGIWNGSIPSCTAMCQTPAEVTGVDVVRKDLEDGGAELHFSCPGEGTLQGSEVITCDTSGWNASFPCCYTFKVGDKVRVKPSVDTPFYQWGKASHDSVGPITRVKPDQLNVNFPKQSGWMAVKDEMELVPPIDCAAIHGMK